MSDEMKMLDGIKRYSIGTGHDDFGATIEPEEDSLGTWVRFNDVHELIESVARRAVEAEKKAKEARSGVGILTEHHRKTVKKLEASESRVRELEEAVKLLGAFIAVPAKYHKDRGAFCAAECLGTCEDCANERLRIEAMKAICANPVARAALERKSDRVE